MRAALVGPYGTRGNIDAKLHGQLGRHASLPPGRILQRHPDDELADVFGQARPANPRFPFPEQLETTAMPSDERLRLDDHQSAPPVEQFRPEDEGETSGGG